MTTPFRFPALRASALRASAVYIAALRVARFGGVVAIGVLFAPLSATAQAPAGGSPGESRVHALTTPSGLQLHNVSAAAVTHAGRRGLRITELDSAQRRGGGAQDSASGTERLAVITDSEFGDGIIELEVAGAPASGAGGGARGFVGVAFRLQPELRTYDAFYLRPTNGRADDQIRRNHSAQYISHPSWPWERLRRETPERYESYVDLEPGVWTRIRVEVKGERARLFVHGQPQPTLIVNDLKTGATSRGAIALWIGPGTVAHFRNLRLRALPR